MRTTALYRHAVAGLLLALVGGASTSPISAQQIDDPRFDDIRNPRITTRASETVLEVKAVGDPNVVGGSAFGLVFQLYYMAPQTPKAPPGPAGRARWPSPKDTPRDQWIGLYALPVPAGTEVPSHQAPPGIEARITTWEYDTIAEVLYVGPYDREQPTLDALREFAIDEGYEVLEGHEEEYVVGPTMTGPGNPEEYLTILRYRLASRSAGTGEIRAARDASNAAFAAHDLDAVMGFWTEDIVMTAGSGTGAIGASAWREILETQFARYPDAVYVRIPEAVEMSHVAALAAERGRWVGTWTAEAGPVESGGTYGAMWREDDGRWRIRSQLFVTLSCVGDGCAAARTP